MNSRSGQEAGFTIIEVLVSAAVLVVGLLGVVALVDNANQTTSTTLSREGATTLARDLIERARQLPYTTITTTNVRSALSDAASAGAVSGSSFTLVRRNRTYTVSFTSCKVDAPGDGTGIHDAGYCDYGDPAPGGATAPAASGTGASLGLKLLGIALNVNASGSVVDAVCSLIGLNTVASVPALSSILGPTGTTNALLGLVRSGADVNVCTTSGAPQYALDTVPDDLTRATADVSWSDRGSTGHVVQSTLIPNPANP